VQLLPHRRCVHVIWLYAINEM